MGTPPVMPPSHWMPPPVMGAHLVDMRPCGCFIFYEHFVNKYLFINVPLSVNKLVRIIFYFEIGRIDLFLEIRSHQG